MYTYYVLQVCIHISLGIFNRLYSLLKNACHELGVCSRLRETQEFIWEVFVCTEKAVRTAEVASGHRARLQRW